MAASELNISLFGLLRAQFGNALPVIRCTKATLVHLSHTLEDLVLRERIPALMFTGFQESGHWRQETERYQALANVAQQVCIFAGGTLPPESTASQLHVTLKGDDPLRQEWFLAILSTQFTVLLCGQDRATPVGDEAMRQFDTIWSFDAAVINCVLDRLEEVIAEYRPERLPALQTARRAYPPTAPDAAIVTRLTAELVSFEERLNQQLRQAKEEAERASRAKSEFLGRMSHELRTPLNAVIGFAQILELDDPTSDEQRENIQHILQGGRHLLNLINEVLDLAKIEAGRLELSLEPVRIRPLVDDTLALIQPLAAAQQITVEHRSVGQGTWQVVVDQHRLQQVLLNLLSNAIKYNRPSGTITITYSEPAEGWLRVGVTDTGHGIPAEDMGRLFTPFERLRAERTGVEGTGIGLALSKALVEAMGGTIGLYSTVGQGSTFWFELPRAEHTPQPADGNTDVLITQAAAPSAVSKVLYIEDNLSNLRLVQRIVARRPSVELLSAMQGGLGIDLAREHRPDLIFLDLNLPDLSGAEVLKRLQHDPRTAAIPLVVISADATPRQIATIMNLGVRAYLTKPLDVQEFLQVLDDALLHRSGALVG